MLHCNTMHLRRIGSLLIAALLFGSGASDRLAAQEMLHPRLDVREVVQGLETPTTMAFIGEDDLFVLEKNNGRVLRIDDGSMSIVLDLAVNFASERGLLGIVLHPDFDETGYVYLYWTESSTGIDKNELDATPLLGNRIDRFIWDGASLTQDINLIRLRALQPPNPPFETRAFGNHDGGVLAFGLDGKLYAFIGDVGRRGQLQNLPCGPTLDCPGDTVPDDQFGGPEPDDAHMTGVVLRLNDDGTAPTDNPFFDAGAAIGGEVGENIQQIYSYGHRNSFGMAVDPLSGNVWVQENGDDSFSELNLIEPGTNGGWIQISGPVGRIQQFKEIETTFGSMALQQERWPPTNIADTPEEALARLFMLPGARYSDPEFSWKWEVSPAGMGFVEGRGLGPQFRGDLFMGAALPILEGGYLFHFNLTGNRRKIAVDDPRLEDRVADNLAKHELTESESLLIGRNFGSVTDIEMGPNGNLFVVSMSNGAIYEIFAKGNRGNRAEANPARSGRGSSQGSAAAAKAAGTAGHAEIPGHMQLLQNYPNPFNPQTVIQYALSDEVRVRLEVFDLMGRRIATLVDEVQTAGHHDVVFDASALPNGVYAYRLQAEAFTEMKRMTVLK